MYQGESIVPQKKPQLIIRGPSGRPNGLGRRNPHSASNTRKSCQTFNHSIAISNGLDKISTLITGKKIKRQPVISKLNPFKKMMDAFLKFTK